MEEEEEEEEEGEVESSSSDQHLSEGQIKRSKYLNHDPQEQLALQAIKLTPRGEQSNSSIQGNGMRIEENNVEDIFAALERLHYKRRTKIHASQNDSETNSDRERRKKLSNLYKRYKES